MGKNKREEQKMARICCPHCGASIYTQISPALYECESCYTRFPTPIELTEEGWHFLRAKYNLDIGEYASSLKDFDFYIQSFTAPPTYASGADTYKKYADANFGALRALFYVGYVGEEPIFDRISERDVMQTDYAKTLQSLHEREEEIDEIRDALDRCREFLRVHNDDVDVYICETDTSGQEIKKEQSAFFDRFDGKPLVFYMGSKNATQLTKTKATTYLMAQRATVLCAFPKDKEEFFQEEMFLQVKGFFAVESNAKKVLLFCPKNVWDEIKNDHRCPQAMTLQGVTINIKKTDDSVAILETLKDCFPQRPFGIMNIEGEAQGRRNKFVYKNAAQEQIERRRRRAFRELKNVGNKVVSAPNIQSISINVFKSGIVPDTSILHRAQGLAATGEFEEYLDYYDELPTEKITSELAFLAMCATTDCRNEKEFFGEGIKKYDPENADLVEDFFKTLKDPGQLTPFIQYIKDVLDEGEIGNTRLFYDCFYNYGDDRIYAFNRDVFNSFAEGFPQSDIKEIREMIEMANEALLALYSAKQIGTENYLLGIANLAKSIYKSGYPEEAERFITDRDKNFLKDAVVYYTYLQIRFRSYFDRTGGYDKKALEDFFRNVEDADGYNDVKAFFEEKNPNSRVADRFLQAIADRMQKLASEGDFSETDRWMDVIKDFSFTGRSGENGSMATLATIIAEYDEYDRNVFSLLEKTLESVLSDGGEATYIDLFKTFGDYAREENDFITATKCYEKVLEIAPRDYDAAYGALFAGIEEINDDNFSNIIRLQDITLVERVLIIANDRRRILRDMTSAFIECVRKEKNVGEEQLALFDDLIRFFDRPEEVKNNLFEMAKALQEKGLFKPAYDYYVRCLYINNRFSKAYWGIYQVACNCRNDEELTKSRIKKEAKAKKRKKDALPEDIYFEDLLDISAFGEARTQEGRAEIKKKFMYNIPGCALVYAANDDEREHYYMLLKKSVPKKDFREKFENRERESKKLKKGDRR